MSIFPTTILLTADGSKESTLVLETAVDIAQKTASEPHVVYIRDAPDYFDDFFIGSMVDEEDLQKLAVEAQKLLEDLVKQIDAAGGAVAQAHLRVGRPDKEIVGLGEELGAGLIVIGSRGLGGIRRALMGSICNTVVRHAHCPVLVVRRDQASQPPRESPST